MKVILLKELKGRGGEATSLKLPMVTPTTTCDPGLRPQGDQGQPSSSSSSASTTSPSARRLALPDAEAMRTKLDGATVKVLANVGEEGQLFGSVTSSIVADAIKENLGVEVDRRRVELGQPRSRLPASPCCRYLHLSRHQGHRYRECRERQGCRGSGRGRGCRGSRRGSSCSC